MNARHILLLALTAFSVTLAILIGSRLSTEALAILLGVLIGVAASLPSTLILAWALNRSHPTPPPAITVLPSPALPPTPAPAMPPPLPAVSQRQFVVIGGDELAN